MGWLFVAIIVINAAIATLIVLLSRPDPAPPTYVAAGGGGGGDVDARVRMLLARLEMQQRELEARRAEIDALNALVHELSKKVQAAEAERTVPRKPVPPVAPKLVLPNKVSVRPTTPTPPVAPQSGVPESIDRAAVSTTISAAKPQIAACGQQFPGRGVAKARVHVAPDGTPSSVDVDATNTDLGRCIADVISSLKFPATQQGGAFGYPFVFQ